MANLNVQVATKSPKTSKVIIAKNTPHGVGYFIDGEGRFLFKKQFEEVRRFSEGFAPVKENDKWGFINTKGEVLAPCIYDEVWRFFEGLAPVEQNGKWGFINTRGEVIIPCIYDSTSGFNEGFAFVEQNGKWGISTLMESWSFLAFMTQRMDLMKALLLSSKTINGA